MVGTGVWALFRAGCWRRVGAFLLPSGIVCETHFVFMNLCLKQPVNFFINFFCFPRQSHKRHQNALYLYSFFCKIISRDCTNHCARAPGKALS